MDPAFAQTLVAAILEKAPMSSTYKAQPKDVSFGSKAKTNRTNHSNNASQSLKDIAR